MPKRYRWTFVDGRRAQSVDFTGTVGISQSSQKGRYISLKEKFFWFAINENLRWFYPLAIKTRSSYHFSSPTETGPDIPRGHHLGNLSGRISAMAKDVRTIDNMAHVLGIPSAMADLCVHL